ncbi:filamentous hemagglutinin N-terminal domain-containing protein [Methyloversatilis sp. XJ19-49]|uniref:two-partner secretion domain-containing protein n=1 Tax=Methyloversatilis sp. XJ19-49 TaxID=2963429 RepID=UPI00211D0B1E|nr:YDG domain-containing protein [Methyloversatilis sp. XJ19-49]MCQ9379741.1 filamentous hemagglutinin N-terminal domain-containing protein [Methyloversatilis sp. XJ19-49]
MNRSYRSIWNAHTRTFVAASELTRSSGQGTSCVAGVAVEAGCALKALTLSLLMAFAANVHALPVDGTVVAGSATIIREAGSMTIHQNSPNVALNWQSFNIGSGQRVDFVQPDSSSVALNRVLGADPSSILGSLNANGKVFLVNPSGIVFGQGASVNVGGLVASTLDINDVDFMAGKYRFTGNGGTVRNEGSINADGGHVALLGATVSNQGVIVARLGTVTLAAGKSVTLDVAGDNLIKVSVDQGAVRALVENGGLIQADGGQVLLSAQAAGDLLQTVVNNTGVIRAQTIDSRDGTIRLLGDMQTGTVNVGGTLDASAPDGGKGGFVDTSAARVTVAADTRVTTTAARGQTGSWLIDPTDYTIAATGGDITGAVLSANLAGTDIIIQSISGGAGTAGDVNVNDTITWSANTLTLNAQNDININTAMNGSGSARLALEYGQGAVAAGNTSTVNVRAPVNLAAGNNFSTKLGSNGVTKTFTVITSLGSDASSNDGSLQGIVGNLAGNYVLGSDIAAADTSTWNAGAGFTPLVSANLATGFSGTFDGLGHTIADLTINLPTDRAKVGLFGYVVGGTIQNVGLANANVQGGTSIGALAGIIESAAIVRNSYATGAVTGASLHVGGLIGNNGVGSYNTAIRNSYAAVTVIGGEGSGGLVGTSNGSIQNSYASGTVTGSLRTGGLVGRNRGPITDSYATGRVIGTTETGGLVGRNDNAVNRSYATGAVSGTDAVGGLVGWNENYQTVGNSYATGAVTGGRRVGGLVGMNRLNARVSNSYATGAVAGNDTGGLVGWNDGIVTKSFWNTDVFAVGTNGASRFFTGMTGLSTAQMKLLANFTSATTANGNVNPAWDMSSIWVQYDTHTAPLLRSFMTAITVSAIDATKTYDGLATTGGNGVTYSAAPDMDKLLGSVSYSSGVNVGSSALTAGGLYSSQQGYLISYGEGTMTVNKADLTVSGTRAYDGSTVMAGSALIATGMAGETFGLSGVGDTGNLVSKDVQAGSTLASLTGLTLGSSDNGGVAGNYNDLTTAGSAVSITPAILTANVSVTDKIYDGDLTAAATLAITGGLVGSETVTATGVASFNSKDVSSANLVTFSSTSLADGTNGGLATNYSLASGLTAAASIAVKPLTLSGMTAASKVYDGNTVASVSGGALSGLVGAETLAFAGQTGAFVDRNVGTGKAVTVTGIALADGTNGGLASNYSVSGPAGLEGNITRLASVTWVGGVSGNWFDASNWAGGAVPDLANVAHVLIPADVRARFEHGSAQIDSLGSGGRLQLVDGSLSIANGLQLASLEQSGGTLVSSGSVALADFSQSGGSMTGNGDFTVTHHYQQTSAAGSVEFAGNVVITQDSGSTSLGNLATAGALEVTATDGDITQIEGTRIAALTATLSAPAGKVSLAASGNALGTAVIRERTRFDSSMIRLLPITETNFPAAGGGGTSAASSSTFTPSSPGGFVAEALLGISLNLVDQGIRLPTGLQQARTEATRDESL